MHANAKVALLLLGILVGGVVGYVTRPVKVEIARPGQQAGDVDSMQALPMPMSSPDRSDSVLAQASGRIFVFAAGGGIIGLIAGFAAGRL